MRNASYRVAAGAGIVGSTALRTSIKMRRDDSRLSKRYRELAEAAILATPHSNN
jgi:hypothetical protein